MRQRQQCRGNVRATACWIAAAQRAGRDQSTKVKSPGFDLRSAVVYATPEPGGELPRRAVLGGCEVSDQAGTAYTSPAISLPSYGMVRVHQRTFVPAPPPGTDVLELRFRVPTWSEEAQIATTVDLRQGRPSEQLGAT